MQGGGCPLYPATYRSSLFLAYFFFCDCSSAKSAVDNSMAGTVDRSSEGFSRLEPDLAVVRLLTSSCMTQEQRLLRPKEECLSRNSILYCPSVMAPITAFILILPCVPHRIRHVGIFSQSLVTRQTERWRISFY